MEGGREKTRQGRDPETRRGQKGASLRPCAKEGVVLIQLFEAPGEKAEAKYSHLPNAAISADQTDPARGEALPRLSRDEGISTYRSSASCHC
jgi:hypothetical protein